MTEKEKLNENETLWRLFFLQAQVNGIWSAMKHLLRGVDDWDSRATMGFVKCEIGDLIKQTRLLCELLQFNYDECTRLGEERYAESKSLWENRGQGDKWK